MSDSILTQPSVDECKQLQSCASKCLFLLCIDRCCKPLPLWNWTFNPLGPSSNLARPPTKQKATGNRGFLLCCGSLNGGIGKSQQQAHCLADKLRHIMPRCGANLALSWADKMSSNACNPYATRAFASCWTNFRAHYLKLARPLHVNVPDTANACSTSST